MLYVTFQLNKNDSSGKAYNSDMAAKHLWYCIKLLQATDELLVCI